MPCHAMHLFAEQTLSRCAWAEIYYRHHRQKGRSYADALRRLGQRWIKIILSESCYPIILHKADADPCRLLEIQGRNDSRDACGSPREAYGPAGDHSKLRQL